MKKLTKYNTNYFTGAMGANTVYHLFQREGQPIHIKASFASGSRFDTKPGIAHFLEHMLLAGTKNYPNKRFLVAPLENIGGMIGGSTNTDLLTISLEIAEKKDLPLALKILDEVINQPLFDEQSIETERGAILTEIQMRRHNRAIFVTDIADKIVYQRTSCGNMVIGNEQSVKLINKNDLVNFYEKIFKESPVNWSIAGDAGEKDIIGPLAKIHDKDKLFKTLFDDKLPIIREKFIELEVFEDDKADLYFGFRTDLAGFSDAVTLDVISSYLAQGRGCKLQEELRYKQGLVYNCNGNNFSSFDRGDWYITTACSVDNTQKVVDIISEEIRSIRDKGVSEDELRLIKNKITKSNIIKLQTSRSWADIGSRAYFIASPEKFLIDDYEKAIENVSNSSIMEVAKKYFSSNNWYLSMCGPKSLENIKVSF